MGKITDYELNSCIEGHKAKNNLSGSQYVSYLRGKDTHESESAVDTGLKAATF